MAWQLDEMGAVKAITIMRKGPRRSTEVMSWSPQKHVTGVGLRHRESAAGLRSERAYSAAIVCGLELISSALATPAP